MKTKCPRKDRDSITAEVHKIKQIVSKNQWSRDKGGNISSIQCEYVKLQGPRSALHTAQCCSA